MDQQLSTTNKEALQAMGEYLSNYFNQDENLFIYSTNLTYFGRIYNYLW